MGRRLAGVTSQGVPVYAPASSPENWSVMADIVKTLRAHAAAPPPATVVKVRQASQDAVSVSARA